ncbi:MAG: phospholipid carrier-dependent glycosyltransferase [Patescibacteria group bacterium]|nr:phospholipid carrier-dependent glycosyltransferase [Patescibacteria group bacterium]
MKRFLPPALVALASAVTHLLYFGYPAQVVFDETYSGRFLGDISRGTFFFDVHPPLAKLIVYAFGLLTGASYGADVGSIGDALPHSLVLLRIVPLACGILLPLAVYGIARNIGLSRVAASLAGFAAAFESSLIVQSRFILFDSMLLIFGFGAILCWQEYRKRRAGKRLSGAGASFLAMSAILAAGAFSVKWTGLAFPALILLFEGREALRLPAGTAMKRVRDRVAAAARSIAPFVAAFAVAGAAVYAGSFAAELALASGPGTGDQFVSRSFHQESFPAQLVDLNVAMYQENAHGMSSHPYQSPWWSWPLMLRPIFYWVGSGAYIYLFGDPFTYWMSAAALLAVFGHCLSAKRRAQGADAERREAGIFIAIGFLANYAPFVLITRPMFLYHYQAALVFGILALAWAADLVPARKKLAVAATIAAACLAGYIYWSPLIYGTHLDQAQLQARMWLPSWR